MTIKMHKARHVTEKLRDYALGKLEKKKLDMIVANLVGDGRGFETDDNAVDIYWRTGSESLAQAPKSKLARQIVAVIAARFEESQTRPGLTAV